MFSTTKKISKVEFAGGEYEKEQTDYYVYYPVITLSDGTIYNMEEIWIGSDK